MLLRYRVTTSIAPRQLVHPLMAWIQRTRCVSKNVFIGVLSAESRLNNYLGSDRSGWGYLANKAIWHNKAKVCPERMLSLYFEGINPAGNKRRIALTFRAYGVYRRDRPSADLCA